MQTDLNLQWEHMYWVTFTDVAAQTCQLVHCFVFIASFEVSKVHAGYSDHFLPVVSLLLIMSPPPTKCVGHVVLRLIL